MIKNFILGFGCGILILAAAIYFLYGAEAAQPEPDAAAIITDDEVIARSRDLGMLFYMDFIRSEKEPEQNAPSPKPEEIVIYETIKEELSDAEVVLRALALGMDFFYGDEDAEPVIDLNTEPVTNPTPTPTPQPSSTPTPTPTQSPAPTSSPAAVADSEGNSEDGEIRVRISYGANAKAISETLYNSGVIADARDFVDFIIERGMAARLLSGEHVFRNGMNYEEILAVLRGSKAR